MRCWTTRTFGRGQHLAAGVVTNLGQASVPFVTSQGFLESQKQTNRKTINSDGCDMKEQKSAPTRLAVILISPSLILLVPIRRCLVAVLALEEGTATASPAASSCPELREPPVKGSRLERCSGAGWSREGRRCSGAVTPPAVCQTLERTGFHPFSPSSSHPACYIPFFCFASDLFPPSLPSPNFSSCLSPRLYLLLCRVISSAPSPHPTISHHPPSLPCLPSPLPRPWGTIRVLRLTLV